MSSKQVRIAEAPSSSLTAHYTAACRLRLPCSRPGDGTHAVAHGSRGEAGRAGAAPSDRRPGAGAAEDGGGGALLRGRVGQMASVQEALRGASRALLHNHLRHCATEAIRSGDEAKAEAMYQELLELVYRARTADRAMERARATAAPGCLRCAAPAARTALRHRRRAPARSGRTGARPGPAGRATGSARGGSALPDSRSTRRTAPRAASSRRRPTGWCGSLHPPSRYRLPRPPFPPAPGSSGRRTSVDRATRETRPGAGGCGRCRPRAHRLDPTLEPRHQLGGFGVPPECTSDLAIDSRTSATVRGSELSTRGATWTPPRAPPPRARSPRRPRRGPG